MDRDIRYDSYCGSVYGTYVIQTLSHSLIKEKINSCFVMERLVSDNVKHENFMADFFSFGKHYCLSLMEDSYKPFTHKLYVDM